MKIANLEREMTKKEKAKEKRLKDKYDDSDMKKSMKKQYGKDWKNVYYATIRKKAMEQDTNEGYYKMPNIDKERYTPMPGLEGPFQTMSGKPVYYDPKEGSYYDRDTDMYLTYAEFKALDDPKPTIGKDVNEVDKSAIDAAVQQALDSNIPVPKTRPTKVPRPKPRPVMIGSNPKTGATRGIDPALNYSPEDLKRLLMQSAMERMETEGKSLASLRNRSSFDAQARLKDKNKLPAPKIVKPAQLDLFNDSVQNEGEAGLDKNFFRNIASMDEPHEEINRLLTADGPEGDVIRREYEITAGENSLHPDDDFEEILDMMVHDFEDMTFEGHSPHKKGTKKYKAHMAAMHANSVDLNAMRDALKLDESTDANTIVAQYTRATLDQRHDTWGKVCEQIDHVRSFVKEDIDIRTVKNQILKMHEQEKIDNKILIVENIDKLRQIVKDKSAMPIKFTDGSMKVDMTTASIFLQIFDKVKAETQAKIVDRIQTKAGFLSMLDLMYKKIG